MEVNTNFEKAVRQHLDALLPAMLESEDLAPQDIPQTDYIALQKRKRQKMMENVASIVISRLSSGLKVSIENTMLG